MIRRGDNYYKFYMSDEYQAYLKKEKKLKLVKFKKPILAIGLSSIILGVTLTNTDFDNDYSIDDKKKIEIDEDEKELEDDEIYVAGEKNLVGISFNDSSLSTTKNVYATEENLVEVNLNESASFSTNGAVSIENNGTTVTFKPTEVTSGPSLLTVSEEESKIDFNDILIASGGSVKSNKELDTPTYGPIPDKKTQDKFIKLQNKREGLEKKKEVLNNFKKCNSIEDVYKRKKELESINLTKEDKVYEDCKLSPELQRFIYEQAVMNKLPVDHVFSIIYTETRGSFNSSGEESYNRPGNYDLGLTQQNSVYSVKNIFCKKFNMSYDKAYKLVRDNDFVNILCFFEECDEIRKQYPTFNPTEYAGCYNGWLNWRNKPISRQYVDIYTDAYYGKYKKHHNIENIDNNKKVKSKTK